ncbi:lipopolysaccharide biosynthesis protein [Alteromonas sp.]|uniref:lipopolysaccharide biosynthesis protein n=1 Tax=Alteromonas sp. TaxID=232 RepID=UPI000B62F1FA|nr:lipopolysaccharide biosynthesis protein [Alteromonas sp.]MAI37322.1 hypothetical protein [Alteromonas sp.]OUX88906.1 MAG: hypothetical protein CBB95_06680 [Alteromonas sp. TMED35]
MKKVTSLSAKTTKALSVFGVMKATNVIISILSIFILAKLLSPEDFGLVAMASVFAIAMQTAFQIPVNQALILKKNPDRDDFNTAFTINVIRGAAIFGLLASIAYPLSIFYEEPLVTLIAIAFSISLLLSGFENPSLITLEQELKVKRILYLNVIAQFSGVIISIVIALETGSYWAMVIGHIANQIVRLVLSYFFQPYVPWFSLVHWKAMLSFSIWISLSKLVLTLADKLDQILIGKVLGATILGQFNIGNEIARKPTQEFSGILNRGLFPAFSKLRNDSHRSLMAYQNAISVSTSLFFPVGVGIALLAEPVVLLTLGTKWQDSIIIVQALGAISALSNVNSITKALFMANNMTKSIFKRDFVFACTKIVLVIAGLSLNGLEGVLMAIASGRLIMLIINWFMVKQTFGLKIASQFALLLRQTFSVLIMAGLFIWWLPAINIPETINIETSSKIILQIMWHATIGVLIYITSHVTLWLALRRPLGLEEKLLSLIKKSN